MRTSWTFHCNGSETTQISKETFVEHEAQTSSFALMEINTITSRSNIFSCEGNIHINGL
jgi:hypothetical protein